MALGINNLGFLQFGMGVDIRQSRCQHLRIWHRVFRSSAASALAGTEKGRQTSHL